jgi:hypothetical protein
LDKSKSFFSDFTTSNAFELFQGSFEWSPNMHQATDSKYIVSSSHGVITPIGISLEIARKIFQQLGSNAARSGGVKLKQDHLAVLRASNHDPHVGIARRALSWQGQNLHSGFVHLNNVTTYNLIQEKISQWEESFGDFDHPGCQSCSGYKNTIPSQDRFLPMEGQVIAVFSCHHLSKQGRRGQSSRGWDQEH